MTTKEQWRSIPGYEGFYEVSDLGRVRGVERLVMQGRRSIRIRGRDLKAKPAKRGGYLAVNLTRDGQNTTRTVHTLVMSAFVGPRPTAETDIRHLNGDPTDSRLSNLAYGSKSQNGHDRVGHGRHFQVAKTHCPQGHPYDEANTMAYRRAGGRRCRTCHNARTLAWHNNRNAERRAASRSA